MSDKFLLDPRAITVTKNQVRDHLSSVIELARTASRMRLTNDNLPDVLDALDNELQAVILIVQSVRGVK